jgi:hypothetical protein
MQFKDIRIDLRFSGVENVNEVIAEDTLSKILLDKDQIPSTDGNNVTKYRQNDLFC